MSRTYLLVYSDTLGPRERVKKWADTSPLVTMWRYDLPHCFDLISEATAVELSRDLERALDQDGRYLLTEVTPNREGRLPVDTWALLTRAAPPAAAPTATPAEAPA